MAAPKSRRIRTTWRGVLAGSRSATAPVHDLHRLLREVRYHREALGRVTGRPAHGRSPRLRAFERALGEWRDLTLFRGWLGEARRRAERADDLAWVAQALRWTRGEEQAARDRAIALGRRLSVPAGIAPARRSRGTRPDGWALEFQRRRAALRAAHRRASARLSVRRAHDLRKELRRTGFLLDLWARETRGGTVPRPPRVKRLLADLGRLHDLDRAKDHLSRAPAGGGRRRWARRLRRYRQSLEPVIRRALRSRSVRQFRRLEMVRSAPARTSARRPALRGRRRGEATRTVRPRPRGRRG